MQNNKSIYLFSVLRKHAANIGIISGIVLCTLLMFKINSHFENILSSWQFSSITVAIQNTFKQSANNRYDAYILGSSQSAQLQTSILSNDFNINVLISSPPGGEILYTYNMVKALAAKSSTRPIIIAEFSRYVPSAIEKRLYRDILYYLPAKYWLPNEWYFAFSDPEFRKYMWQGIEDDIIPIIRYSYAINALIYKNHNKLLSWLINPEFFPKNIKRIVINSDGHSAPYPLGKYPYRLPSKNYKHPTPPKHKIETWKKLLDMHLRGEIFLILIKPPYHSIYQYYYDTLPVVNELEATFKSNGVYVVDCTTLKMKKEDCFDAHHFTVKGCAKFTQKVGEELTNILASISFNK
ncbi:MAG: hypothetical protein DRI44_00595 [Chlamydiae bacterium]|nr:MAG: hypothetical protein DRI44_00595 [Chlamydiota bacterium]